MRMQTSKISQNYDILNYKYKHDLNKKIVFFCVVILYVSKI